jgi:tetratricopeptide (TPR) repeat protein
MTPKQRTQGPGFSLSMAAVVLLAACAQTPPAPPKPAPSDAPTASPVPDGKPASPTSAPSAPAPVVVMSPQDMQRSVTSAIEYLEAGLEEPAETELRKVLASDPNQRLAQSLLRQIKEDPVGILGRESFSYRVQPGESLSKIAQRFINNDPHLFYALARYNNIKVPRSLAGGQTIRVPGRAPVVMERQTPTAAPPAPSSSPAPAPSPVPAPVVVTPAAPAASSAAEIALAGQQVKRKRQEEINRLSKAALAASAKQDLDGAIRNWDAVLNLDPNNGKAKLERGRAEELREKLRRVN